MEGRVGIVKREERAGAECRGEEGEKKGRKKEEGAEQRKTEKSRQCEAKGKEMRG